MKAIFVTAIAVGQLLFATEARAAKCAKSSAVEARLESRFGERLTYVGQGRENHDVLVYTSRQTGRWTMIVATPEGFSCLVASGRGERSLDQQLGERLNVAFR